MANGNYMTTEEVAHALNVSVGTVKRWRSKGGGPRVTVLGPRCVRYLKSDVLAFMRASRR